MLLDMKTTEAKAYEIERPVTLLADHSVEFACAVIVAMLPIEFLVFLGCARRRFIFATPRQSADRRHLVANATEEHRGISR